MTSTVKVLTIASINLFICAAGAGLLSFPYAVKNQGIAITIATTIIAAALSLVFGTLEEVVTLSIGKQGGKCALFTVVVGCFGAIIGFLILIGDVIVPLSVALCSNSSSAMCEFCTSRVYMILTFTVLVVIPVSSLPNFSHLTVGSFLAVFSLAVVVVSVIYTGAKVSQVSENFEMPANSWAKNSWTIILGIPIAIFSLGNHSQVAQISFEVSKLDYKAGKEFHLSVVSATALCIVVYLLTGIYGFMAFGNNTLGDVLLNFGIYDNIAAICRSLMAFHIALALPVQVIPLRSALLQHYSHLFGDIYNQGSSEILKTDGSNNTSLALNSDSDHNSQKSPFYGNNNSDITAISHTTRHFLPPSQSSSITIKLVMVTSLIVLPCAAIAILLPEIALVFGLLGSSVSTLQIYILPGYMLWFDSYKDDNNYSYSETRTTEQDSIDKGDALIMDGEYCSSHASEEMTYMPSRAESKRIRGAVIVILGVCIAVIGTTTFLLDALRLIR